MLFNYSLCKSIEIVAKYKSSQNHLLISESSRNVKIKLNLKSLDMNNEGK